jgi:hypothetical protein
MMLSGDEEEVKRESVGLGERNFSAVFSLKYL